jgi:hypothetical protein
MLKNKTNIDSLTGEESPQKKEFAMNELTNNDAGRDVAAGTNTNDDRPTYEKLIRKSAGIGRTKDARKLQSLRSDIRDCQSDLRVRVGEMEASVESIQDDLDRLAQMDEIAMVHGQIDKLDEVLGAVQNQVTELLSA